jgi:hypothetical protein
LEYKKEFNAIMELKKIVHPNFVKMIEELEGNKQGLTMGISSDVPLEPGNYEKNFVTMYKIQFPFNDGLAAGEIEKIKKDCTIKPEEIYLKECK